MNGSWAILRNLRRKARGSYSIRSANASTSTSTICCWRSPESEPRSSTEATDRTLESRHRQAASPLSSPCSPRARRVARACAGALAQPTGQDAAGDRSNGKPLPGPYRSWVRQVEGAHRARTGEGDPAPAARGARGSPAACTPTGASGSICGAGSRRRARSCYHELGHLFDLRVMGRARPAGLQAPDRQAQELVVPRHQPAGRAVRRGVRAVRAAQDGRAAHARLLRVRHRPTQAPRRLRDHAPHAAARRAAARAAQEPAAGVRAAIRSGASAAAFEASRGGVAARPDHGPAARLTPATLGAWTSRCSTAPSPSWAARLSLPPDVGVDRAGRGRLLRGDDQPSRGAAPRARASDARSPASTSSRRRWPPTGPRRRCFTPPTVARLETVLMRYRDGRRSLCLSSQSGCPLTCTFCATGSMKFGRNLTESEILDQALHFRRKMVTSAGHPVPPSETDGAVRAPRLDHAVFMGMGEPLLNLDAVLGCLRAAARRGHPPVEHHDLHRRLDSGHRAGSPSARAPPSASRSRCTPPTTRCARS